MKNGVLLRPSFFRPLVEAVRHDQAAMAFKASRNIGEVAKVSARALIGASFGSVAVGETKPQRIGPRCFSAFDDRLDDLARGDVVARMPVSPPSLRTHLTKRE
jgi:hypothetical protein